MPILPISHHGPTHASASNHRGCMLSSRQQPWDLSVSPILMAAKRGLSTSGIWLLFSLARERSKSCDLEGKRSRVFAILLAKFTFRCSEWSCGFQHPSIAQNPVKDPRSLKRQTHVPARGSRREGDNPTWTGRSRISSMLRGHTSSRPAPRSFEFDTDLHWVAILLFPSAIKTG